MAITSLKITNVGPFDEIEFEFDRQVNVFTGPNNSGKSSALWVLGDITVYPFAFPRKLLRRGYTAYFKSHISGASETEFDGQLPVSLSGHDDTQEYWTKERWDEHVGILKKIGYSKFIPALRRSSDYRSPGPIATRREDSERELVSFQQDDIELVRSDRTARRRPNRGRRSEEEERDPELRRRLTLVSENPSLVSDEAVIQKIVELDYRSYLRREPAYREIIVKIGEMASEITEGFPIEFIGVDEDSHGFFQSFAQTMDKCP